MMRRTTADYFADIGEAEEFVVCLAQCWRRIGKGVTSLISATAGELNTNRVEWRSGFSRCMSTRKTHPGIGIGYLGLELGSGIGDRDRDQDWVSRIG